MRRRLTIRKDILISEIQSQFSALHPNLKIEFYPKYFKREPRKMEGQSKLCIGANIKHKITIDVSESKTIWEVKRQFSKLGIECRIFRNLGNTWVETIFTEAWTLARQNKESLLWNM